MKYVYGRIGGCGGFELSKGMQRRSTGIRFGAMIAVAVATSSAFGFIDERQTVQPPQSAPAGVIAQPQIAMAVPGAAPRRGPDALQGDFSGADWYAPYPGPFGPMPLADSLIAQFVPIVGPIRLEGDSSLFQTPVAIPQGLARSAALRAVAERAGVVVRLKGNNVVSVEPMRVAPMGIAEQMGAQTQAFTQTLQQPVGYQALPPAAIPAAPAAPQPTFDPAPIERWVSQSDKGMTLKQVVKEWAERNGQWKVRWTASNDYPAPDMEWNGDFLEAIDRTLAPYGRIKRPIEPVLHRDGGQQILEIADKRN